MHIALFGAGRIGEYHAGLLAGHDEVTGVTLVDAIAERAETVAAAWPGVTAASGENEAVAIADAMFIASSTDTHARLLHLAADAGLPAFCEKPIALDLPSTRAAVDAVEQAGIVVQMGFQRRYDPAIRRIKDAGDTGALGTVYLVRSQTHDPAPPPLEYIPHSGGMFKDCLIHDIDAVRYVTGQEVVTVRATGNATGHPEIERLGDISSALAMFEMSGGALAQLSGLRKDGVGYDVRLEVFGSDDALAAGWSSRSPIHSAEPGMERAEDPITTFWDRFDAAYRAEIDAFVKVVAGEEVPLATAQDAYEDLRVAVACALSHREGRTVHLDEITEDHPG